MARYGFKMSSLVMFSMDVGRLAEYYEAVLGVTSSQDPWGGDPVSWRRTRDTRSPDSAGSRRHHRGANSS